MRRVVRELKAARIRCDAAALKAHDAWYHCQTAQGWRYETHVAFTYSLDLLHVDNGEGAVYGLTRIDALQWLKGEHPTSWCRTRETARLRPHLLPQQGLGSSARFRCWEKRMIYRGHLPTTGTRYRWALSE